VRTLLRRWGVLFWRLLAREAAWLPSWRDLLLCCRRLEARGELRGGRFVAGFSGEQYASPEAVGLLREVRRRAPAGQYAAISGADPLNLLGILTPGTRLPSLTSNRLLYLDGLPDTMLCGGALVFLRPQGPEDQWRARNAILRRQRPMDRGVVS
jgi:ATP-dependent Lhr-like helicase